MMYALTIESVVALTERCFEYHLAVPDELKEIFRYRPGQHLTFEEVIDGEKIRRNYSICSGPQDVYLAIAIKQIPGGRFSNFALSEWQPGRIVRTLKPMGRFVLPDPPPGKQQHYIALLGGSGITPVMAMLRHGLFKHPTIHFTLFYSNSTVRDMAFREVLEGLKNNYMDRLSIHHILTGELLDNPLFSGRIDAWKLQQWNQHVVDFRHADGIFLCGPGDLMQISRETLLELGVPSTNIHMEWFSPPKQPISTTNRMGPATQQPETSHATIEVIRQGQHIRIPVQHSMQTILEAAEAADLDLPYSCRGGVCATCKTRLLEGEVTMATNYALEPDELKANYILACQAIPRSEHLIISYDGD